MQIMNLTDAKAHFSEVINQVIAGENIIVERMGIPVAKIVPYQPEKRNKLLGVMAGKANVPDDFNEWPEEEAKLLGIIDTENNL